MSFHWATAKLNRHSYNIIGTRDMTSVKSSLTHCYYEIPARVIKTIQYKNGSDKSNPFWSEEQHSNNSQSTYVVCPFELLSEKGTKYRTCPRAAKLPVELIKRALVLFIPSCFHVHFFISTSTCKGIFTYIQS